MLLDTETAEAAHNWLFAPFLRPMVIDTTISRKTLKIGNLRPFLLYPGISAPENMKAATQGGTMLFKKIVYFPI